MYIGARERCRVSWKLAFFVVAVILANAALFWDVNNGSSNEHRSDSAGVSGDQVQKKGQQQQRQRQEERPAAALTEEGRGPGIVQLNFLGRLGNNLFEYAAARALADQLGWALSLQAAPGNRQKYSTLLRPDGMACFPGVRPLGPPASSPEMASLEAVTFRGVRRELEDATPRTIVMKDWFQEFRLFSGDKARLRQIMALNTSCCGPTAPGPNDLVIHHRNYRAELTDEQYAKLHFKDLDYKFYDTVIRDSAGGGGGGNAAAAAAKGHRPETIWIVGEIDENDALVNLLQEEHENVRIAEMVDGQFRAFCFLARAPRLVMAHSTFSWWAAFLGNATEVHFPLSARGAGVTGPSVVVKGDPRYVYRNDAGRVVSPQ